MKTPGTPHIRRRTALLAGAAVPWLHLRAHAADGLYRSEPGWVDDRGRPFALARLQGSWTVTTMAYGACRRICSTSLRLMQQVQQLADSRQQSVQFVVFGIDPAQDTPADWAALRTAQRLERDNWTFLTGDAAATRAMAARLGIRFWRYGEHTMHDFRILLLTPQGDIARALVAFNEPVTTLLPAP